MENSQKAAYLAGFFDGEGSVLILKRKGSWSEKNPGYPLVIIVGNTDPKPILEFKKFFGFRKVEKKTAQKEGWKPLYYWRCTGNRAKKVLTTLYPYLILKKKQAELGLAFQANKEVLRRNSKGQFIEKPVDLYESFRKKMAELNKKGTK